MLRVEVGFLNSILMMVTVSYTHVYGVQDYVMKCSSNLMCNGFMEEKVINGCTKMVVDGTSQAFSFSPTDMRLITYSDSECNSVSSNVIYNVSDPLIVCNYPDSTRNPCGTGINYKIEIIDRQEEYISSYSSHDYVMMCSDGVCDTFFEEKTIRGCTRMSTGDSSQSFTFDTEEMRLTTYSDTSCTMVLGKINYNVSDPTLLCSYPGQVMSPCGTGKNYKIRKIETTSTSGTGNVNNAASIMPIASTAGTGNVNNAASIVPIASTTDTGNVDNGALIAPPAARQFAMKCSSDICSTFIEEKKISGCTRMLSSGSNGQSFTYDPAGMRFTAYSDANCTAALSWTRYYVSGTSLRCNSPGSLMNPCGNGIRYKIEEIYGNLADDDASVSDEPPTDLVEKEEIEEPEYYVMKCSTDVCENFLEEKKINGCTKMSDNSSHAFIFNSAERTLSTYGDASCTIFLGRIPYDVDDTRLICNYPGEVVDPCGEGINYKIEKFDPQNNNNEEDNDNDIGQIDYDNNQYIMRCSSDGCGSFTDEVEINGCTKISNEYSHAFTFDPSSRNLTTYVDSECTTVLSTLTYDNNNVATCSYIGVQMNPCGTTLNYKIEVMELPTVMSGPPANVLSPNGYVMKCSTDTNCGTFNEEIEINGCTKMLGGGNESNSSQSFIFDPIQQRLTTYSDNECINILRSTDYDISEPNNNCSIPEQLISPCGAGNGYTIEAITASGHDTNVAAITNDVSSASSVNFIGGAKDTTIIVRILMTIVITIWSIS